MASEAYWKSAPQPAAVGLRALAQELQQLQLMSIDRIYYISVVTLKSSTAEDLEPWSTTRIQRLQYSSCLALCLAPLPTCSSRFSLHLVGCSGLGVCPRGRSIPRLTVEGSSS